MKVSYAEGLASYGGPESCVHSRKGVCEALTGERAGRVLSRVIHAPWRRVTGCPGCRGGGVTPKATPCLPHWRGRHGPRAVTDPVHARKHLAREPGDPASFCAALGSVDGRAHREARGHTTMSDGRGKSDCCVVPKKLPNKAAGASPAAAEVVEGRRQAKGNAFAARMSRRSIRVYDVGTALEGIRQTARGNKGARFSGLLHHIYAVERLGRPTTRSGAMRQPGWTARPGSRTGRRCKRTLQTCPTGWPAGATGPSQ